MNKFCKKCGKKTFWRVVGTETDCIICGYGEEWDVNFHSLSRSSAGELFFSKKEKQNTDRTLYKNLDTAAREYKAISRSTWSGVDLVDGELLTSAGQEYFEAVIPNLGVYAPALFSGGLSNPDFVERDFDMSYRDELDNFWSGSALANSWDSASAFTGLPVIFVRTLATLILGAVASWYIVRTTGESILTFPIMAVAIAGGTIINWIPLQLTAIMGFMGILIIGFTLWLKRAT